jgi:hypothetical protein
MDLFFQFSSFCNFKQKPEGVGVEDGVEVEEWKPGREGWGWLWHLSQRKSRQKGEGREESKSQLERGFWFFFFSGNRTTGLCLQQRAYYISS